MVLGLLGTAAASTGFSLSNQSPAAARGGRNEDSGDLSQNVGGDDGLGEALGDFARREPAWAAALILGLATLATLLIGWIIAGVLPKRGKEQNGG